MINFKKSKVNIFKLEDIEDNEIVLHHHLGLGDHLICNGLVNQISNNLRTIYLPVKTHYYEMIKFLYKENDKIKLFQVSNNNSENDVLQYAKVNNKKILRIGFELVKNNPFNTFFYKQIGLPYDYSFTYFHIPNAVKEEKKLMNHLLKFYNIDNSEFAIVHNESHEGTYNLKNIKTSNVIYMTKESDLFNNMLLYRELIINAKEIHCINSSFLHLVDRIKTNANLYYHDIRHSKFSLGEKWNVINYDN